MPSIRKRGNRWFAEVRIKGQPALRKSHPTQREAKAWAHEQESKLRRGGRVSMEKLSYLIEQFIEAKDLPAYQVKVLDWWRDRLGGVKLSELRKADFLEARRALQKLPKAKGEGTISPATVNRRMAAISAVLSFGIHELCLLETNPAQVPALTEDNARDRLLTEDERGRLLAACRAHPEPALYALVRTAMVTGARAGELLGLTWKDIDLEAGVARLVDTKNGDSRPVPIAGEALELLRERQRTLRRFDNDLVFYNTRSGKRYNYRQHWAAVKRQAGIENFRFHDLRHQAASELAMAGVPLMQIGALLGHRSAQMTKRYSHYSQEAIRGLGDILADKIG